MRKFGKMLLIILKTMLIFIALGELTTASTKYVWKIALVEQFKSQGVLQEDISTAYEKYYLVSRPGEKPSYTEAYGEIIPGYEGDILVSTDAKLLGPFVDSIISFFAGGHAAICTNDYKDYDIKLNNTTSIESTGLNDGDNPASIFDRDYWAYDHNYHEVIGLRVDMTERERAEVISAAAAMLGDPYNFSFFFDTINKSYCSDLVSKAYASIGKNLNKDRFTTSIYDLIVSADTYISYYHYFDSDGVKHIYYFG